MYNDMQEMRPYNTLVYSNSVLFVCLFQAKKDELLKQADRHEQDEASTNEKKASARTKKLEDERRERLSQLNAWKVNDVIINFKNSLLFIFIFFG